MYPNNEAPSLIRFHESISFCSFLGLRVCHGGDMRDVITTLGTTPRRVCQTCTACITRRVMSQVPDLFAGCMDTWGHCRKEGLQTVNFWQRLLYMCLFVALLSSVHQYIQFPLKFMYVQVFFICRVILGFLGASTNSTNFYTIAMFF